MQVPAYLSLGSWKEWQFPRTAISRPPLRLWQTYKSVKPPEDGMDAYWSWRELNPHLQMIMHDDHQASECILHLYGPEVHKIYQDFPLAVMRADFWRYAILYAFGGIYADVDVRALRPIQEWLPPEPDGVHWPPNNASAVHPGWEDCRLLVGLENALHVEQWVSGLVTQLFMFIKS